MKTGDLWGRPFRSDSYQRTRLLTTSPVAASSNHISEKGTPISRSQVKAKSQLALQLLTVGFPFISTCLVEPVVPVSSSMAMTESCQTPIWIKR